MSDLDLWPIGDSHPGQRVGRTGCALVERHDGYIPAAGIDDTCICQCGGLRIAWLEGAAAIECMCHCSFFPY